MKRNIPIDEDTIKTAITHLADAKTYILFSMGKDGSDYGPSVLVNGFQGDLAECIAHCIVQNPDLYDIVESAMLLADQAKLRMN